LQARHEWEPLYGEQLAGATVGLIGLGAINGAIAARLRGFDVRLLATRRTVTPAMAGPSSGVDALYPPDRLHEMLAECDAVIAAVPETPETRGTMDRVAFAAMKAGSLFANVGRGSLVDEVALIDALQSGHLRAAALDVTRVEPLPPNDPLWDAPNLYLSFHCSTSPKALFRNVHTIFRDNLARFLAGDALPNVVDAERGY
jgi:phosphoglycerate dehydrogenase-like enzyme